MFFSALRKLKQSKRLIRGFTLIELLVVISIIGLLTAVATVSYTNVQKKSRDGKRKSDLAAIQQALEVFYADNGAYPDEGWDAGRTYDRPTCKIDGTGIGTNGIVAGTAFACTVGASTKTYMSKMPADPSTGLGYYYEMDTGFCQGVDGIKCQNYTLWASLENEKDPDVAKTTTDMICSGAKTLAGGGSYPGLDSTHYNGNYCVYPKK